MTNVLPHCSVKQFLVFKCLVIKLNYIMETLKLKLTNTKRIKIILIFIKIFYMGDTVFEQTETSFKLKLGQVGLSQLSFVNCEG